MEEEFEWWRGGDSPKMKENQREFEDKRKTISKTREKRNKAKVQQLINILKKEIERHQINSNHKNLF